MSLGALFLHAIYTRKHVDVEVYAALCGSAEKNWTPPHRPSGVIFGEHMPYTHERLVVFCSRLAPTLERELEGWRKLGVVEVADALIDILRLFRFILSHNDDSLPGVSLVYEQLNLEYSQSDVTQN